MSSLQKLLVDTGFDTGYTKNIEIDTTNLSRTVASMANSIKRPAITKPRPDFPHFNGAT
jgi:hypothetical protein